MPRQFVRPTSNDIDNAKLTAFADKVFQKFGKDRSKGLLVILARENAILTKESNILRAELGYELLPEYEVPE